MKPAVLAALACAALVAGCGGNDTSSERLSKPAFVAQANKICRDAEARADAVKQPADAGGLDRFVDETKPIVEDQRAKFRDLEARAPADLSADLSKSNDLLDELIDTFAEFKDAGTDQAKIGAITRDLERLQAQSNTLAGKMGLKECDE